MRGAHGQSPGGAVGGIKGACYHPAMKPYPYREADNRSDAGHSPIPAPRSSERSPRASGGSGAPPVIPYWRYPSRTHHGHPWYPRGGRPPRYATAALLPHRGSTLFSVRVIALLAIIAIMVVLAIRS